MANRLHGYDLLNISLDPISALPQVVKVFIFNHQNSGEDLSQLVTRPTKSRSRSSTARIPTRGAVIRVLVNHRGK